MAQPRVIIAQKVFGRRRGLKQKKPAVPVLLEVEIV
jgi:hypothetical protein